MLTTRLLNRWRATSADRRAADASSAAVPEWLDGKYLRKFAARYLDIIATSREITASPRPLVIGPWMSEVGYELLYWIPMLRFLHQTVGWDAQRAATVTRGGAAIWYEGLASRPCDIFDVLSASEFRSENERRWKTMHGSQKQKRLTDTDRTVLDRAARQLGTPEYASLHPELMYKHLNFYWRGLLGLEWYSSLTAFAPMQVPSLGLADRLPRDYFAVKFYFRPSFPHSPENIAFIRSVIERLSREKPVVVIETGQRVDDHAEYVHEGSPAEDRVIRMNVGDRPATNLALQTEIIARSSGFFGTYGGLCYIPMYFGLPATGFVSHDEHVFLLHETAAQHACSVLRQQHGLAGARLKVFNTAERWC